MWRRLIGRCFWVVCLSAFSSLSLALHRSLRGCCAVFCCVVLGLTIHHSLRTRTRTTTTGTVGSTDFLPRSPSRSRSRSRSRRYADPHLSAPHFHHHHHHHPLPHQKRQNQSASLRAPRAQSDDAPPPRADQGRGAGDLCVRGEHRAAAGGVRQRVHAYAGVLSGRAGEAVEAEAVRGWEVIGWGFSGGCVCLGSSIDRGL